MGQNGRLFRSRASVVRLYRWQPRGLPVGRRWVDDPTMACALARFLTDADLLVIDVPRGAAAEHADGTDLDAGRATWYYLPPHVLRAARPLALETQEQVA